MKYYDYLTELLYKCVRGIRRGSSVGEAFNNIQLMIASNLSK